MLARFIPYVSVNHAPKISAPGKEEERIKREEMAADWGRICCSSRM